jgi:hypothetical protein
MSRDPHLNPYAPPTAEVVMPTTETELRMKRPRSVKWALAFFLFGTVVLLTVNGQWIAREGWQPFLESCRTDPLMVVELVGRFAGLFVLVFGGRRPWAYWVTVIALGIFLCGLPRTIYHQVGFAMAGRDAIDAVPELVVLTGFSALLVWLFYRITFGRPSRLYFRVAKP